MKKIFKQLTLLVSMSVCALMISVSCSKNKDTAPKPIESVIVINEGNYMAGNADITIYDLVGRTATQNVFASANQGAAMGDSPAGALIYNKQLFVTLSGSGKMYVIDTTDFTLANKITGLNSPRNILIESATKGYITNLNKNVIDVFNPSTMTLSGQIDLGGEVTVGSEQMVMDGRHIYTNQWSYGTEILKINADNGKVVQRLKVGIQPISIHMDCNGDLWTLCDGGGWSGNPVGYEAPSIVRIKVNSLTGVMSVVDRFELPIGSSGLRMIMGKDGDRLYFLNGGLWSIGIGDTSLPSRPLVSITLTNFYNLAQHPQSGDLYLTDAIDYSRGGEVYRYSVDGCIIERFGSGVCPSLVLF